MTGTAEPRAARLKRMRMRSMRRGIKEMDLILSRFADDCLDTLAEPELRAYDRLLSANDQELYAWVTGQAAPPDGLAALVARIASHARGAVRT